MSSSNQKTLAVVAAVICVTAAGIFWVSNKPLYYAHTTIELKTPAEDLQTQLHLLESDSILVKAAAKAKLPNVIQTAKDRLSIRRDTTSNQVQIEYGGTSQQDAATFVNALVAVYSDELAARAAARSRTVAAEISSLLSELQESEATLANYPPENPSESAAEGALHIAALTQEVTARRNIYQRMLQSGQESMSEETTVRIVERAEAPVQNSTSPWSGLAFGVPTTLFGGFLFFFSRRRARELGTVLANPEVVPEQAPQPKQEDPAASQIVAVTSMSAGFTHPEILHDFVESLMTPDSKILVVDCEVGGAFTTSVGLKGSTGLSDFLAQPPSEQPMLPTWKSTREGVFIMPAGKMPHRIPALLSKPAAAEAIDYLRSRGFTHIVFNAPSILTAGEMRHLTPCVDGVVLVTPTERSRDLPYAAVRQVEEYGGRVLGILADLPADGPLAQAAA